MDTVELNRWKIETRTVYIDYVALQVARTRLITLRTPWVREVSRRSNEPANGEQVRGDRNERERERERDTESGYRRTANLLYRPSALLLHHIQ